MRGRMMHNPTRTMAVLFVDDEEKTRKYFRKAFSKEFRILTADSVATAGEILEDLHDEIGIVITDQRMPNENGVILLKLIKEQYPNILRMLTTAYSDLDEAIAAVNSGEIMRYIQKPWNLLELKGELKYALRHAHTLRERDALYQEKLGVQQRLIAINRVRDLVVMAGSFSHLRNSLPAIQSFLFQDPFIGDQADNEEKLDMWALMESEINHTLQLTSKVINLTQGATEVFIPTSISSIWSLTAPKLVDLNVAHDPIDPNLPEVAVELHLIIQALCLLFREVSSLAKDDDQIFLHANGNAGNLLTLSVLIPTKTDELNWSLKLSPEILSVFLIAYHHGGDVRASNLEDDRGNLWGIELVLPADPDTVKLAPPPAYWLNDVLSSFESYEKPGHNSVSVF